MQGGGTLVFLLCFLVDADEFVLTVFSCLFFTGLVGFFWGGFFDVSYITCTVMAVYCARLV